MTTARAALAGLRLAVALAFSAPVMTFAQPPAKAIKAPEFRYDIGWMKLPQQWLIGDVSAVAVDRRDNVWVLQRPLSLPAESRGRAAPAVLQFDSTGRYLRGWGGPGGGYDWPTNEHSLFIDDEDRVWISGSSRAPNSADSMILAFTADGKLIRQIGARDATRGDQDTTNVNAPADLFVDVRRKELYVADGYGNRRVIVFDSETGAYKRMWGAFGAPPPTTPFPPPPPILRPAGAPDETGEGPREFRSVHGVELSRDGLLYVSDRDGRRVQVFDRNGGYRTQVFIHRNHPNRQTASGLGLSSDRAQRWLYVIDFGNAGLLVLDRKTLALAAEIGSKGTAPGQFIGPHLMSVDSKGAIYVAEVQGRRVQKLTPAP